MGLLNFNLRHRLPLFGLDIGHSSLKVMQLDINSRIKNPTVLGYGMSRRYDTSSIVNGVIMDYKALSDALHDLFERRLIGSISSRRVACTIPMSHSFSRPLKLPAMSGEELAEAVRLEAEQYIPVPPDSLYIDFDIVRQDGESIDLLLVATPKNIVESYMKLLKSVGLEPVALEPTMNSTARIFGLADSANDVPTVLIDFGADATDAAIFDKTLFVNSTIQGGGSTMIALIAEKLAVSREEAYTIKNQEGLGYGGRTADIRAAVMPILDTLVREIRKITRYYDERMTASGSKISQAVTTGGGANMPGLSEHLSKELGMPVRMLNPWGKINFGGLIPPDELERSMFITVAGEAVLDTSEVLND